MQECTGHRYYTRHCWHVAHIGPKTILYRCCECGKHKREYSTGIKPNQESAGVRRRRPALKTPEHTDIILQRKFEDKAL